MRGGVRVEVFSPASPGSSGLFEDGGKEGGEDSDQGVDGGDEIGDAFDDAKTRQLGGLVGFLLPVWRQERREEGVKEFAMMQNPVSS